MSHPDPLYDPENSYEDDDMIVEDENYDDYEDFYHDLDKFEFLDPVHVLFFRGEARLQASLFLGIS